MKRGREDGASSVAAAKRAPSAKVASGPQSHTKLTTTDALSYLREVKTRFSSNKEVYDSFLEIMKEFKAQRIDTAGVIQRVKQLFKGHRELVLGFNTFLPKGYEIELARISDDEEEEVDEKKPIEFDQAITYVNKIKVRFASDERVYKAFLEILNMYRKGHKTISKVYGEVAELFRHQQDLLDEFTYFLPDNSHPQPQPAPRGGRQPRPGLLSRGPTARAVEPAISHSASDPRSVHKRKAARRAEEGFKQGYGAGSYDAEEEPVAQPAQLHQMFERIKTRLRNREAYSDLLKCLNMYNQDIISRQELLLLVSDIIGRHVDLMDGFVDFLKKTEMQDVEAPGVAKPGSQMTMLRETTLSRETMRQKMLRDKFMTKPLSEIVAHEQERVTTSYVPIPAGYPKLSTRGRTELGHSVLNETLANVVIGSEDYSFKLMRKNQYEEALFRCEDDRYEFEMCIETNAAALKLLKPILELSNKMGPDEKSAYQLEKGHALLGPVPANAIERLYSDSGALVVEYLRRHPAVIAPVVAARMEAKDAEWRKVREDMTRTWRKIYELNYHKSLDHRSFYFKQAEKRSLLPKAMILEVREGAEQRKAQQPSRGLEAHYRSLLCHTHRQEPPKGQAADLSFDYPDKKVFDDCWWIIRTAILESSGGSQQAVVELYLTALEPFFGLTLRKDELDKIKAEMREKRAARRGEPGGEDSDDDSSGPNEEAKNRVPESTPELGVETDMDAEEGLPKKRAGNGDGSRSGGGSGSTFKREDSTTSDGECGSGAEEGEDTKHVFNHCMPLAPYFIDTRDDCATDQPVSIVKKEEEGEQGKGSSSNSSRLMLCNEMLYVLFRFHRHLYERMRTARRCAAQQSQQLSRGGGQQFRQMQFSINDAEGTKRTPEEMEAEAQMRENANKMHSSFMNMAQRLITGEMESVLYEDQVRALLGTNSYELFTLDKLLQKLVAHMKSLVQDAQSSNLLKLHTYEQSRGPGSSRATYYINSLAILSETAYRIEFNDNTSQLGVSLMPDEHSDSLLSAGGPIPAVEGSVNDYIADLVNSEPGGLAACITMDHSQAAPGDEDAPFNGNKLILKRNLPPEERRVIESSSCSAADSENAHVRALASVAVLNSLECKLSCSSSKVSYVLDTEDVMYRWKRGPKRKSVLQRVSRGERFGTWFAEIIKRLKAEEEAVMALAGPNAMSTEDAGAVDAPAGVDEPGAQ